MIIRTNVYDNDKYWEAVQMMANRMAFSEQKYGSLEDSYPDRFKALTQVSNRIKYYIETGNTEWLIDAANFCLIEHLHPASPNAHFRATGSEESPGLIQDGT